jgi:hypothetical protein
MWGGNSLGYKTVLCRVCSVLLIFVQFCNILLEAGFNLFYRLRMKLAGIKTVANMAPTKCGVRDLCLFQFLTEIIHFNLKAQQIQPNGQHLCKKSG